MPDTVLYALMVAMPIVVLIAFVCMYLGGNRRSELGQPIEHEARCGRRFDHFTLSMPFLRHTLYRDFAVFPYGRTNFRLPYEDVLSVTESRYILARFLTYKHRRPELPERIVVSTWSGAQFIDTLKKKGVRIERDA